MFFSDMKQQISQIIDEPNNPIPPPNKSVTTLCNIAVYIFFLNCNFFFKYLITISKGSKSENKPDKNEIKPQETQGSKRPLPNSFFQMDEYYDQFCKPSLYFPSIQK